MVEIKGAGGGGKYSGGSSGATMHTQTTRPPEESENTLRSRATARIFDVLSEGEIEGFADSPIIPQSVYFDDTPWLNADLTWNFNNISLDHRLGTPGQAYINGFPAVETSISVGQEVTTYNPAGNKPTGTGAVARTITNPNVDAVRVTVRLDALYFQVPPDGVLGNPPASPTPPLLHGPPAGAVAGDIVEAEVGIQVEISADGGPFVEQIADPLIIGKSTSPYQRSYRIELTGDAPWIIRMSRTTDDFQGTYLEAYYRNRSWFSSYTEIIDNKLMYPDTAYVGLFIDATAFGGRVPLRSYHIKGIKIQIPDNYDPETRIYSGAWSGGFDTAYSNNPAWVIYDLLTNTRYGLGEFILPAQVDKWALYDVAVWCDELVPKNDGTLGGEPRYTCNAVINARQDAYKVLQAVASIFHGMIYWSSGMVTVIADKPEDPVKLVTPANVIDGMISYQGAALKARHTTAMVTWNNPDEGYRATVELAEDADGINELGLRELSVAAFGCTSRGQAIREARWALETEKTENEIATYRASLDQANVRPGNIILLQDPAYAGVRFSGRVVSASLGGLTMTLDAPITLTAGNDYQIHFVRSDGTIHDVTIQDGAGTYTTVNVSSFLGLAPEPNAVWLITSTVVSPRPFRIISVRESEKNLYEITGLFHNVNKYLNVEQGWSISPATFTIIPTGPLIPPTEITVIEYMYLAGTAAKSAATVSWLHTTDPRLVFYEVQKLPPFGSWADVGTTVNNSTTILDTFDGTWSFRIRAADGVGNFSAWATLTTGLVALSEPPEDVTDFVIDIVGTQVNLDWSPVSDLDLAYYQIRFTPLLVGATWGTAALLATGLTNTSYTGSAAVGTYLIKAFDSSSSESQNAALVITNIATIFGINNVTTITEDPGYSGSKTNVVVVTSALQIDDLTLGSGTYEFANDYDLGAVFTSRLTLLLESGGVLTTNTMDSWVPLSIAVPLESADPFDWDVIVYVRTTEDDPAGTPTWTAWQPFVIGDYTARAFEFKAELITNDGITTPNVTGLEVIIDMEDRTESANDFTTSASGDTITFSLPFKDVPAIALSIQNAQNGDYYTITNKTATGFDLDVYNSADAGVVRLIDWIAKGYGHEI